MNPKKQIFCKENCDVTKIKGSSSIQVVHATKTLVGVKSRERAGHQIVSLVPIRVSVNTRSRQFLTERTHTREGTAFMLFKNGH